MPSENISKGLLCFKSPEEYITRYGQRSRFHSSSGFPSLILTLDELQLPPFVLPFFLYPIILGGRARTITLMYKRWQIVIHLTLSIKNYNDMKKNI